MLLALGKSYLKMDNNGLDERKILVFVDGGGNGNNFLAKG